MKVLKLFSVALACGLFLSMGALTTRADAEPFDAPYLDNQSHVLPARAATWYRFEFLVDHPAWFCRFIACAEREVFYGNIVIHLPGAARNGLQFEVYAPGQIGNWRNNDPVGRGNPENDELTWAGSSNENGVWYVRVVNDTPGALTYRFNVQGVRLLLSREAGATPTPTLSFYDQYEQSKRPTPTPTPLNVIPTEPSKAVNVDSQTHALAPRSEWWYVVTFPPGRDKLTLKLLDGGSNGLRFDMYAPERIGQWWKEDPLGRGNREGADLVWTGDRDASDKRYIRIVNNTDHVVNFFLVVDTYEPKPAPRPFEFR